MRQLRILTIQDLSCVGQCSLTVALPILSACALETAVLPTALLSTHTGGFQGYTFRDLTGDLPAIVSHWQSEGLRFDAFYSGYLGSAKQAEIVRALPDGLAAPGAPVIVDPAMADNGRLYAGFDEAFVESMKLLCKRADYLLPNLTEACLLTGTPYRAGYDRSYLTDLLARLHETFPGTVVLTGIGGQADETGVVVSSKAETCHYRHRRLQRDCHGTGDVFASVFTGALLRGLKPSRAARTAADFTLTCMEGTEPAHWYGVRFEPLLPRLQDFLMGQDASGTAD